MSETFITKALDSEAVKAIRVQTAAFEAKSISKECFIASGCYSFGHTISGTLLGTHGAVFRSVCQKTKGERGKATGFRTIVVRKNDLLRELELFQRIIERKNTTPILANVLMEARGDDAFRAGQEPTPNIEAHRKQRRIKYGVGANAEQDRGKR